MFKYNRYKDRMNQLDSASITTAELYSLNKRTSRSGNSSRDKQRQYCYNYAGLLETDESKEITNQYVKDPPET